MNHIAEGEDADDFFRELLKIPRPVSDEDVEAAKKAFGKDAV